MNRVLGAGSYLASIFAGLALIVGVVAMPVGEVRGDPVPIDPKCDYKCIIGVLPTCAPTGTCAKSAASPANAFCNGCKGDKVDVAGELKCVVSCKSGTIGT